ncbi:uncharacterized protein PAC_00227 [Phialocephala subalpina]|uniref:Uncharacterized protein n=1 Tax=Phialocephala subalpina TaxID=576137 RepID=A0A1L7WC45_9HELO|nr:uncharacterized protein PAC_00227 [Phialocephala subalpina]
MPQRFTEPAQRARGRTITIQKQNPHHANWTPSRAPIPKVAEQKPIQPPPTPIPAPPRRALPIPIDGAAMVKARLHSARGKEHSAFLDLVEKALSFEAKRYATVSGDYLLCVQGTLGALLDHLDEATATCLALTCHSFYQLHRIRYPNSTSLQSQTTSKTSGKSEQFYLYEILKSWMPKELQYFAINNFNDGKYLTKKQCLKKVLEKNKGVHRFNKTGCWGIWDEGQEVAVLQYGAYQEVVFRLCHDKVKIKEREEYGGVKWQLVMDTPKQPWVKFALTDPRDWRQTPRILT